MKLRLRERRGARLSRRSSSQVGVALVYHSIAEYAGDPRFELVPPLSTKTFEAQLRHLRETYRIVPPSELLEAAQRRRRGDRFPVAISFDDDLRSHADLAAPSLLRAGVPAAFFLCGASLDGPGNFWWSDLQEAVGCHRRAGLPLRLRSLPELDLDPSIRGVPGAIHESAGVIERLPPDHRDEVATELRTYARPSEDPLETREIEALADAGFEIGYHTRRHYLLPTLDDDRLLNAMEEGRETLEAMVGRRLTMIAYPHGKADKRVANAARAADYQFGFTAFATAVGRASDPLLMGRIDASSVPLEEFPRTIQSVLMRGGV